MTSKPNPSDSQRQPCQTFLEIYEKMVKDSRSFAHKMVEALERESKKRRNTDKTS